jgi:hypothetical protein
MNIRFFIPHFLVFFDDLIHFRHVGPQYEYVIIQKMQQIDRKTTSCSYLQKLNETELDYLKIPSFFKRQISKFTTESLFLHNNSSILFNVKSNFYSINGNISFIKKPIYSYDCTIHIDKMNFFIPYIAVPPRIKNLIKDQIYLQLIRDFNFTIDHSNNLSN